MMIGSDTSGLEYWPTEEEAAAHRQKHGSFMPIHKDLAIEQGVHIAEIHDLEEISSTKT